MRTERTALIVLLTWTLLGARAYGQPQASAEPAQTTPAPVAGDTAQPPAQPAPRRTPTPAAGAHAAASPERPTGPAQSAGKPARRGAKPATPAATAPSQAAETTPDKSPERRSGAPIDPWAETPAAAQTRPATTAPERAGTAGAGPQPGLACPRRSRKLSGRVRFHPEEPDLAPGTSRGRRHRAPTRVLHAARNDERL